MTAHLSTGVDLVEVERLQSAIERHGDRLLQRVFTPRELADSQANYIGRLPLSLESNSGVAGALINLEMHDLGLDYYRQYPDLVRAVTAEQILETAARYLHPDRLGIAVAGTLPETQEASG